MGERAWLLVVHLQFNAQADGTRTAPATAPIHSCSLRARDLGPLFAVTKFLEAFTPMADAVSRAEPGTLGYEVSVSDQNPLSMMIYERYRTKDEYLSVHKAMKHFLKFRPKLQELQDAKKVVVTGESFRELGVGFM